MLYVCDEKLHFKNTLCFNSLKTLCILTFSLLLGCGGPPQFLDEGSESPAVLAITSDTTVDFPDVVNGFTYSPTLTIENLSNTVPANTFVIASNITAPFAYVGGAYPGTGGTCSDTLDPGQSCTIELSLNPVAIGNFTSSIDIEYFDGLATQNLVIDLSATARDPFPANLSLTPTGAHDFGVIAIGGFAELDMTVNNTGELDATALNLAGLSGPMSVTNDTCGVTIVQGSSCTFTVRFDPAAQTVTNQTLSVNYFDGTAPQIENKAFSGEGRVAGFLTIDQGMSFDFQTINNGFFSDQALTVRNTGGGNASTITFSGLLAPFSITTNTCPATLTPGASCSLVVRFTPTTTTTFNDALEIDYFDGFNAQVSTPVFLGQGFANIPTLTLMAPAGTPSNVDTPTIQAGNLITGIDVRLYSNNTCGAQVATGTTAGTTIDFSPTMAEGIYEFHVRIVDSNGNLSSCSVANVPYEYDNTRPNPPSNINLAANFTASATTSPNFTWNASSSADVVDYQVGISTNAAGGNSDGGYTSKGNVASGNQTGLSMVECQYYFVSLQSIDDVGLVSATHAVSASSYRYDSAVPTPPSSLNESGDGSTNNSATVTWNASTDTCGISHYEVAVGEDVNGNNTLDPGEIGNAVAYTNVGTVTSHRFNGLTLTNGVAHFTSIRAVDTTGRFSAVAVSDPWIVYDPSIELPDMIVWLDGNDPSSILDSAGRDALDPAFNGEVNTWLDKSGSPNTHNFTAVSAATRPDYNDTNFTVDFDGVNTVMTTGNHPEINTATVTQRNITVAFQTSADIATRQVLYEEGGNIRGMNVYIFNNRIYCGFYNDPGGVGGSDDPDTDQPFTWVSAPIAINRTYFVTWVYDYTNHPAPTGDLTCYLDGASIGTTPTTSRLFAHSGAVGLGEVNGQSVFEDGSVPGSGHNFLGSIYEVMLFNNAPDASDITNVHTYLDNKWN